MEKIWLKHYPPSVPPVIDVERYHSLADLLKKSCHQFSNRPAFTQLGFTLTYSDVEEKSRYFAAYLHYRLQLKKGDRFGLMLPNTFQFVIAFFAALRLGLVVVPINPLDTPRELAYQLKDAQISALLVLDQFVGTVHSVLAKNFLKHLIVTDFPDVLPLFKRFLVQGVLKITRVYKSLRRLFKKAPARPHPPKKPISFLAALAMGKTLPYEDPEVSLEDLALIQYTGGTTGTPKGALLTHRNMVANVIQCIAWVKPALILGEERILIALPLYHIFSLTVCCLSFLSIGGLGLLVADPRHTSSLIGVLKRAKPTVLVGVNTLFQAWMKHPRFKTLDFSCWRLTISGGMKLQAAVANRWQALTGQVILEGYGLTEASPVVSVNPLNLTAFNGSVGFPLPSTEVSIRNNASEEVSLGEVGELWVRGPQVMQGYLNQVPETKNVLAPEGWLKTGDMAYVDSGGFVYLVDRKKEMIIVSGFNVYPSEVESVIDLLPGVSEVAVVGVPDPETGEAVKAYIVKKSPQLTRKDILSHCRLNLLPYKIPHQIQFVKHIPKSSVGKILKRALISRDYKKRGA